MSLTRQCPHCQGHVLGHQWDELLKCCTPCGSALERPDYSWMRRDRHPPNLKRFAKLGAQLELERRDRNQANAETP